MRRIGRYEVLGLLGRGGMGAVYKAAMPHTGRVVALKLLRPSEQLAATADQDALRRGFFREAALMAGIRHPGVAQVLDVDEDRDGRPFFVMEYYCDNLGAQLGEGPRVEEPCRALGVARSLDLARQLASALARLHHEGVLHRDVKPFNLMLAHRPDDFPGGSDELKLIDFGLSRLRGEREAGRPRGAVVGSPWYAAPEQEADPATADERADIFSAGVTLFRCLTGRLPQDGLLSSFLRPGLDERFDAFFASCCAQRPALRPSSARALLAELDGLSAHWTRLREAVCALPPEAGEPAPAPRRATAGVLRSRPVRQPLSGARERFGLDALWRPQASAPERFRVLDGEGGQLVRDESTGLLWQRGGSAYAVTLAGAREHAKRLDAQGFGGVRGWRLPTVEELATLLLPEPDLRQLCLPGVFEPAQRRLWSADRKSYSASWYADAEHGFIWWQDDTCQFHARCVCSGA
ncbi:serine/threonine protein kinase [Humidesulfovibrio mexicanus]|uniref:Serine/threonine protein kinase n=1 Tax=Humidesulfovibrio mexicanus TaxID=147047 RepID=A0A239ARH5_9BACT|nr:protein kinase [Humidesulfovibrio mexicanus]SNR97951.1 serine/threonine protein kinase [Humidesulfovibrio mexicanus]